MVKKYVEALALLAFPLALFAHPLYSEEVEKDPELRATKAAYGELQGGPQEAGAVKAQASAPVRRVDGKMIMRRYRAIKGRDVAWRDIKEKEQDITLKGLALALIATGLFWPLTFAVGLGTGFVAIAVAGGFFYYWTREDRKRIKKLEDDVKKLTQEVQE